MALYGKYILMKNGSNSLKMKMNIGEADMNVIKIKRADKKSALNQKLKVFLMQPEINYPKLKKLLDKIEKI